MCAAYLSFARLWVKQTRVALLLCFAFVRSLPLVTSRNGILTVYRLNGLASACCIVSQALYDVLHCLATAVPTTLAATLTATARAASAVLSNGIGSIVRSGNGQQRRLAVFTPKCSEGVYVQSLCWLEVRAPSTSNQYGAVCLLGLFVMIHLLLLHILYGGRRYTHFPSVCTFYICTCFLMSLVLPCCSIGLLAGLGAGDMTVDCKLCTAMHVYV